MRRVEYGGVVYGVGTHARLGRVVRDPRTQPEGGERVRLALLDRRAAVVWPSARQGELAAPGERERELALWAREYEALLEAGRTARCRGCGATLRQLRDVRCPGCGWMQCACGSCGCNGVFRRKRKRIIGR
jgi:hypothetical protein